MSITCEVIPGEDVSGDIPFATDEIGRYAGQVLHACGILDAQVNIVVINDETMAGMNETYRHKTGSTDVLSFNLTEPEESILEGEIYVSLDRVRAQATEYGVSDEDEFMRLVTHGLLHLAGRTHGSDEDYRAMMEEADRLISLFWVDGEVLP